ncbi:MAG TPA: hypothetical protein VN428_25330 [Bryobacteraceae bacterium]|nr:hypothetical protein [Bryobacteraceae bacterium]
MRYVLYLLLIVVTVPAQRTLESDRSVMSQVRIDLRDLGYPPADAIPADECAVHALTVAPDGELYGATSGKRSHLFVLFPVHGYVQPLGFLKGVSMVHRSLVVSKSGDVYIGAGDQDGRLYRYVPKNDEAKPIRVDAPLDVTDLGAPAPGEGIYSLAIDRERDVIYGLTRPSGHFFSYKPDTATFALHGKVAEHDIPGEKFEAYKNIGRALAVTPAGQVLASGDNGAIFRFDPTKKMLARLPVSVPGVPGREPYSGVDAWAAAGGWVYGGTSDGYLFRLAPDSARIENLGKPLNQYRIRGLAFAKDGKLYGVGGDDDEMARLFSYDPTRGVYEILGMIDVNRRPYYSWHAYVIDAVAAGLDGTLYLGQAERKSKLYIYHP